MQTLNNGSIGTIISTLNKEQILKIREYLKGITDIIYYSLDDKD